MTVDTQSRLMTLSNKNDSGLDLNLSLHSLTTSTLSNGVNPCSTFAPTVSRGKELYSSPTSGEFEEGGSQNSALSTVNRKRNHQEDRLYHYRRGGSDEDEGEYSRKKLRLSWDQTLILEETFKKHSTLSATQKESLARELGIQTRQVEVWFQNRRARIKVKQTEAEVEYMKQNCLGLMEHIRHLQTEVNELKALNLQSQIYSQIPTATTLTMCPSCERLGVPTSAGSINASLVGLDRESGRTELGSRTSWAPGQVKWEA